METKSCNIVTWSHKSCCSKYFSSILAKITVSVLSVRFIDSAFSCSHTFPHLPICAHFFSFLFALLTFLSFRKTYTQLRSSHYYTLSYCCRDVKIFAAGCKEQKQTVARKPVWTVATLNYNLWRSLFAEGIKPTASRRNNKENYCYSFQTKPPG